MNELVPFERYRIVLYHDYYDTHGESHRVGEPLCVEYSIMHGERFCSVPIMINEMMDKMKHGLLDLVKKEEK